MTGARRRPPVPGGEAAERTALAWSRSALAVIAIAACVAKAGLEAREPALGLAAAIVLAGLAGGVWAIGERRGSARRAVVPTRPPRAGLVLLTAAALFSAAVAAAMAVAS
jgi:uncharacterized membrane protein YidH (DUF202 family)